MPMEDEDAVKEARVVVLHTHRLTEVLSRY